MPVTIRIKDKDYSFVRAFIVRKGKKGKFTGNWKSQRRKAYNLAKRLRKQGFNARVLKTYTGYDVFKGVRIIPIKAETITMNKKRYFLTFSKQSAINHAGGKKNIYRAPSGVYAVRKGK